MKWDDDDDCMQVGRMGGGAMFYHIVILFLDGHYDTSSSFIYCDTYLPSICSLSLERPPWQLTLSPLFGDWLRRCTNYIKRLFSTPFCTNAARVHRQQQLPPNSHKIHNAVCLPLSIIYLSVCLPFLRLFQERDFSILFQVANPFFSAEASVGGCIGSMLFVEMPRRMSIFVTIFDRKQ